ncbi:MAG: hypothetical protein R3D65_10230 [Zhengella sp.]|uniref:hypothetical protein n=1 Tax=Zhengella sp. TaxID=2282762 RepID=UPI00352881FA|nr:hypothetical protein [Brucellaceae bacterium]
MNAAEEHPAVTWIADVPLLTNPIMLRAAAVVFLLAYVLIALIGIGVSIVDGHPERLLPFMAAMLTGFGVVTILMTLVTLFVFGNRMRCRFIIDDAGISTIVVDRRASIAGSLAIFAGAADNNAALASAGLSVAAGRRELTPWKRISGAICDPVRCEIRLTPAGWWPVGRIHCTEESYTAAAAAIRAFLINERKNT